jgi:AcrR family transcriptional regulator
MAKADIQNKTDLRNEILNAAREMFVTEGYTNVSMRKIADKIGYSATTIYLYFKDKNDLLNQICEETFVRLAQNIKAIYHLSDNPLEKLRSGMREYIYFGLKNPSQYTLVFITPLPRDYQPSEILSGEAAFDTLRQVVSECVFANLLKSNDIELTSQTIWAGLHGVTSLLIQHCGFPFVEREKLIANLIDTTITGIKA